MDTASSARAEAIKNLSIVSKLVANLSSLLGRKKSVKCIVDGDSNYQLTCNGLHCLKAIESQEWVYNLLYEHCFNFNERFGFGSEEFLVFVGCWGQCFLSLSLEDIPLDVTKHLTSQTLHGFLQKMMKHHSLEWRSLRELATKISLDGSLHDETFSQQKETEVNPQLPVQTIKGIMKTASRKGKVNFMRYSRYAMDEIQNEKEEMIQPSLPLGEDALSAVIKCACCIEEESVCQQLCKLMWLVYRDQGQKCHEKNSKRKDLSHFNSKNVILRSCHKSPPVTDDGPQVFEGILVTVATNSFWYFGDRIINFKQTSVKIALVNTVAYGDNIHGNSENVNIREVIEYSRLPTTDSKNEILVLNRSYDWNVNLIFYHGELTDSIQEHSIRLNIILIRVEDYGVLFQLSTMTGASILFGFLCDFTENDTAVVSVSFLPSLSMEKMSNVDKIQKQRNDESFGYIQVHNCVEENTEVAVTQSGYSYDSESRLRYTVFQHARSLDLLNLQRELFIDGMKRLEHFFTKNCLTLKNVTQSAEMKMVELLKSASTVEDIREAGSDVYLCPQWLHADNKLFRRRITEEMAFSFERFCNLMNASGEGLSHFMLDDVTYKEYLWTESLYCVIKVASTLKV